MNKFLIANSANYAFDGTAAIAGGHKINTLEAGSLALLAAGGELVPATGFVAGDGVLNQFILGTSQGLLRSGLINRLSMKFTKQIYVAGVNAKWTIGLGSFDVTKAGTVGVEVTRDIVDLDAIYPQRLGSEVGFSAGATRADVVAELRDDLAITLGSDYIVTGAVTDIIIEGKTMKPFYVQGTMAASDNYTIAATTEYVAPINSAEQIAAAELEGSPHSGNMRYVRDNDENYKQNMQVDMSQTYVTYMLQFTGAYDVHNHKNWIFDNGLTIAVPTGSAMIAILDTMLGTFGA